MKVTFTYLLVTILFVSCKKETKENNPPELWVTHTPSPTTKQFNFQKNSKWIFKNTINNSIDTMWVRWSSGMIKQQYTFEEPFEYFQVSIEHTLLPAAWRDIRYVGGEDGISASDNYNSTQMGLGFFEKNIGDSVLYNNPVSVKTWNKIENIHPTITINGATYSNVYEISYHPVWYGFTKIWWCPSIGFVKLEGTNHVTNQFGTWELQSYNVSLY